jgi:hypothetical protein
MMAWITALTTRVHPYGETRGEQTRIGGLFLEIAAVFG